MSLAARHIPHLTRPLTRLSSTASTSRLASAAYTSPTPTPDAATTSTPLDLTQKQRDALDAALRVDQAGEIAANWIYAGQAAVLGRDKKLGGLIQVRKFIAYEEGDK